MANGITLSAGVRQNLLSLQSTASLSALTQNRLATGKKVNSALDNPSNFFTSQALSDRASDLNSLLDSIGQAQKTLEATDKGLTSLTKLVESAKSIAKQARQAAQPSSSYAAVNVASSIDAAANLNGDETIASVTGNSTVAGEFAPQAISLDFTTQTETLGRIGGQNAAVNQTGNGTLSLVINGNTVNVNNITTGDTLAQVAGKITAFAGVAGNVTAVDDGTGRLRLTADNADVDFSVNTGGSTAQVLTDIGYGTPTGNAGVSTSLLDRVVAAGGTAGTSTLTIDVNGGSGGGGATKTITFGTGGGQISTFAELNNELSVVGVGGGASGAITGGAFAGNPAVNAPHLTLSHASGATNTLAISVTDTGTRTALGLGASRAVGQTGGIGAGVSDLSRTFNSAATLADTDPTNLLSGGNITITVNGSAQSVALAGSDRLSDVLTKLRANASLNNNLDFADSSGNLQITAKNADVDFQVAAGAVTTGIGLATTAQNSTSLLDRLNTKLGGSNGQGATLTVSGNGGQTTTLTFGTGSSEISTKAELSTALASVGGGVTASLTGTSLAFQVGAGTSQTSLTFGGTAAAALGFTAGTTSGAVSSTTDNSTRAALQTDYNAVLTQIDTLAKDSSYNGINLLNGDNLKVVFNEKGTSTLNISGVTFGSSGLGLSSVSGTTFQSDAQIDSTITALDGALSSLRTQSSKFGSSLTTVQTRQDFTKQMINTLQTGADALVLADSNEEGANLLALQTRQQLSSTALSLSAQADQAVLRLF
jgi:flagellin